MLNIKDTGFGYPKTYNSILKYDKHEYKDSRLVLDTKNNINLVNNIEIFSQKLKQYKATLFAVNNKEKHKDKHKSKKEINKLFHSSKVLRSFRIVANHIELETLHKSTDTPKQRKQNIINFYKDCLEEFKEVLKNNHCKKGCVEIVQADIHFDQAVPHMHLHISNLYEREFKTIKSKGISCNYKLSDAIRLLNEERKANDYKEKLNDIFANKLAEKNQAYSMINFLDLKKEYALIYDIFKYKKQNKMDLSHLNAGQQWRMDKEIQFKMTKDYLADMHLKIDYKNDIANQRKINDLTLYAFMNTLKQSSIKVENMSFADMWNNKALLKEIIDYHKEFNFHKIEPKDLLNEYSSLVLAKEIGFDFENLKNIEDELLNSLELKNILDQNELEEMIYENKVKNWKNSGFDIDGTMKEEYYSKLRMTEEDRKKLEEEYYKQSR